LDASIHDAPYYLVMPLLRGESLAQQISRGTVSVPAALWIVRQMAEGLAALHQAGWMHGDVKPANAMIAPSGHVTLIDLGLARHVDRRAAESELELFGTLDYLAPERWRSTSAADIRSDLYSLGIVLFELLTGRRPLSRDELDHWDEKGGREAFFPKPLPSFSIRVAPRVPLRVARLLRQMLAQEPLRRPQTPSEVVDRLIDLEVNTFADRS
jgi:serine/threonine-protein kinase